MKKEVLVFIFDGYADWESAYICSGLQAFDTGYTVKTLSLDKEPKISMGGFKILPDYSLEDVPDDFCLLLLIGGEAWKEQKNNAVLPVVESAVRRKIPVGAICNAVNFMAENGYLDSIDHTGNSLEYMKSQAPHYKGDSYYTEQQAVCASNIITANGTGTLEFARAVMTLMKARPDSEISNWYQMEKCGFYPA